MKNGIMYKHLDCLDVLETLEDNKFSLIYLDIPDSIGNRSKRIKFDESRMNPVVTLCRERGCKLKDLTDEEIKLFIEECKNDRKKAYEEYLIKIVQNCFRVLKDKGVIVYREDNGEDSNCDIKYVLESLFYKLGMKVMTPISRINYRNGFDLIHFYSKGSCIEFPYIYELLPIEQFPYEDEMGKYSLESLECSRNKINYFLWDGHYPREGRGWRYSKKELDELSETGYIEEKTDMWGKSFPKLKFYRDEHPVIARPIWNDRNLLERAFELFTTSGDCVLGIYENLYFAHMAEKKNLSWYSVFLNDGSKLRFMGQKEVDGKYMLVEALQNHKERKYSINRQLLPDIKNEKREVYKNIAKEYELYERPSLKVGDTTDEILAYYIDKFLREENMSENAFSQRIGVSKPTISKIRAAIREMNGLNIGKKKIKAKIREKKTIVRIAVYTNMPFVETRCALRASGREFDIDHFQDAAIIEWLSEERKDIQSLNETIHRYGEKMGITEDQYGKFEYEILPENNKKKITISR